MFYEMAVVSNRKEMMSNKKSMIAQKEPEQTDSEGNVQVARSQEPIRRDMWDPHGSARS